MTLLKKCSRCKKYTIKGKCDKCKEETKDAHHKFVKIKSVEEKNKTSK